MIYDFAPGNGVLFMKVGTHARECLSDIIERKAKEIRDVGFALWGYGGNTCHPRTIVQPFAQRFHNDGNPIHLVMEEIDSKHFAEQIAADEYSNDGISWTKVPNEIRVLGSRYALVIESLEPSDITLNLSSTKVPIGPSSGRSGAKYVKGRVDKACLEILSNDEDLVDERESNTYDVHIRLIAKMREPYAVFLRNDPR